MKLDVVEGVLTVEMDKYISLAAYSLQGIYIFFRILAYKTLAEYGDYDESIHTIDFMQTIPLLPKVCINLSLSIGG